MQEEPLRAVLRRTEEDLRYPLGSPQALQGLAQEFAHSPNHIRKIGELGQIGFTHLRRVRGDGNCFYRAVGFGWLEALAARAAAGKVASEQYPSEWPGRSVFGDLGREYDELRQAASLLMQRGAAQQAMEVGQQLFARLLSDVRFDLCIVLLIRHIVADFLGQRSIEDKSAAHIREVVAVQHGSVERYVATEVLPLGQEAEGASIQIAAQQLGVRMRIVQLDGTPGRLPDFVFPSEDYVSPLGVSICLLFRPGHYELLYHAEASRLPDPTLLSGRCSFCREPARLVGSELLTCFHRLCRDCTAQACAGSSAACQTQCPICAEVLPHGFRDSSAFASQGLPPRTHHGGDLRDAPGPCAPPRTSQALQTDAFLLRPQKTNGLSVPGTSRALVDPQSAQKGIAVTPTDCRGGRSIPNTSPPGAAAAPVQFYRPAAAPDVRTGLLPEGLSRAGAPSAMARPEWPERPERPDQLTRTVAPVSSCSGAGAAGNVAAEPAPDQLSRTAAPTVARSEFRRPSKTEASLSSVGLSGRMQRPAQAQCHYCTVGENLRRVRCCGKNFCLVCLKDIVTNSADSPGVPLKCLSCNCSWDLEELKRACGLQTEVSPKYAGQPAIDSGQGAATLRRLERPSTTGTMAMSAATPGLGADAVGSLGADRGAVSPCGATQAGPCQFSTQGALVPEQQRTKAPSCAMCHRAGYRLVPARCCRAWVCLSCDGLGGNPRCVCASGGGAGSGAVHAARFGDGQQALSAGVRPGPPRSSGRQAPAGMPMTMS